MSLKNKKLTIVVVVAFVILGSYFYFAHKPQHELRQRTAFRDLKCPDDYKTDKERNEAFQDFVDYYYEYNPSGSLDYLADSRREFYVRHDCTEALKREADYLNGDVNPETKASIERVIQETFGQ